MNNYTDHLILTKKIFEELLYFSSTGSRGYLITYNSKGSRKGIVRFETAKDQRTFIGEGHTDLDHKILAVATALKPQCWGLIPYHRPVIYEASPEQLKELKQIKVMTGIDDLLIIGDKSLGLINTKTEKWGTPDSSRITIANNDTMRSAIKQKERTFLSRFSA
ncbi:hypothetical protein KY308_04110 [Candidatus Woesearchaeota archaeon]|nr:hypothetical protein [Candidatus Woesearchaeota archaeon]